MKVWFICGQNVQVS